MLYEIRKICDKTVHRIRTVSSNCFPHKNYSPLFFFFFHLYSLGFLTPFYLNFERIFSIQSTRSLHWKAFETLFGSSATPYLTPPSRGFLLLRCERRGLNPGNCGICFRQLPWLPLRGKCIFKDEDIFCVCVCAVPFSSVLSQLGKFPVFRKSEKL